MASITASIHNEPCTQSTARRVFPSEPLILVVEDDWSTRRFICSVLKRSTNAFVMEASGPRNALSKARSIGRPLDLLISDIGLHADKTGIDLAHEITVHNPATRVLLMSGEDFLGGDIPAEWRFLAKPFPLLVFLDCVNELSGSVTRITVLNVTQQARGTLYSV